MNTISSTNIRMFVAGALAFMGFRDVLGLPSYVIAGKEGVLILHAVVSGLALVIGVSMLVGKVQAFLWAETYLGVSIAVTLAIITFSVMHPNSPHFGWKIATAVINPSVLLALLVWSRAKHLQEEPDA